MILHNFYSDDGKREAIVRLDPNGGFRVEFIENSVSSFRTFRLEAKAEMCAEDWVLGYAIWEEL